MKNSRPDKGELQLKMDPSSYQSSESMDDGKPVKIRRRLIPPSPVVLPLIRVWGDLPRSPQYGCS